ncbi:MAG: hypothetical protein [Caudoviricetes sp.]|nr:MAG: hypothetical protein [Caudoviricetes sp.]
MKYVKGNLVTLMKQAVEQNDKKVFFAHGTNCQAAMGSGIAPQIAKAFPQVEEADRLYHKLNDHYHCKHNMLGTVFPVSLTNNVTVFNAYTQYNPGRDLRIDSLRDCFEMLNIMARGAILMIPRIGAGVAGGDWDEISKIIEEQTPDLTVYVIDWDGTLGE